MAHLTGLTDLDFLFERNINSKSFRMQAATSITLLFSYLNDRQ